jgi:ATP-dependent Lon protease
MTSKQSGNNIVRKRGNLQRFPLLPLRDLTIFPHMITPLFVGREKSILALQAAMSTDKTIFLAAQKNGKIDDPQEEDIYTSGTVCQIIQLLRSHDGTIKALVEGKKRGEISSFMDDSGYLIVETEVFNEDNTVNPEIEVLMQRLKSSFASYCKLSKDISPDVLTTVRDIMEPSMLADTIVIHVKMKVEDRQHLLSTLEPGLRIERLLAILESEIEILKLENKIHNRVRKQMEKTQKEYYLNEQLRAIREELGGKDDFKQELCELENKIVRGKLSDEAKNKALSEIRKLGSMSQMSAEAAVSRNYIDWLVKIPWGVFSRENRDISGAEAILDSDHYGLDKVKDRVLEYICVHSRVEGSKAPILCLVGPPGVGKTSLARSLAKATGRNFIKVSLGGMRDEAEIRGHRRTYVGAMPGKIIHGLKKAGTSNPVFLLDEIDKMSSDFRGDPASALLEVLDPEQNSMFSDLFLDVDYDLSRVMFVTTANSLHNIPKPLLDRLEVIRIDGYTENEKLAIARKYLVKKQLKLHGLDETNISFNDQAITEIIRFYTREAGVRGIERQIADLCRKTVRRIVKGSNDKILIKAATVRDFLGPRKFSIGLSEEKEHIGVVTGMAWTESGGDLITIEVSAVPGKGKLTITGKLGEVMQESAQAAFTYVRSRSDLFRLEHDFYQQHDIHVHVPEGSIPKDGPSAGISIATAIASALTRTNVRSDVAMTGEITLRGRVLQVGGLKEKILAAKRGNIKVVIVPKANKNDISDFPQEIFKGIKIKLASHMDEVISFSLPGKFGVTAKHSRS